MLETISPSEFSGGKGLKTEVLIVGSGAGGAVAAKILAEAGRDVLVVEEGLPVDGPTLDLDAASRVRGLWRSGTEASAISTSNLHLPAGRALGGTTVIGSGTAMRPPDRVLEEWAREGMDHLTPAELAREFEEIEAILSVGAVDGEALGPNGELLLSGARSLGFSARPLARSVDGCQGKGVCVLGCPTGAKQSMDRSYLPRAQLNGARMATGVRVTSIETEKERAVGVEAELLVSPSGGWSEREKVLIEAEEVILSAGPFHSPAIMMRSGIGSPEHLGRHLQLHPSAGLMALFDREMQGQPAAIQTGLVDEFASSDGLLIESTALVPGMNPGLNISDKGFVSVFTTDRGEGEVFIDDADELRVRYELHPDDVNALSFGIFQSARILLAAGALEIRTGHPEFASIRSFAEAEAMAKARWRAASMNLTGLHPVGTARMGDDPELSVVDTQGLVWGFENLRVADASVVPSSPGVNPQLTVMAIAASIARSAAA